MVAYRPGSFSKNFAWHGTGLRRLHQAIRAGFQERLQSPMRDDWRTQSGIRDASIELVPINFYLHNRRGRISVDELVYQAVERPHSLRFDRLGLFALHLNRVGQPPQAGPERPAMWANEYAREVLWRGGQWRRGALGETVMDRFLDDRIDADPGVRIKCRSNYRHLFELCGYLGGAPTGSINTGADEWLASALYLTWDRHLLDGGSKDRTVLLGRLDTEEVYKLLGITAADVAAVSGSLIDGYLAAGALDRFRRPTPPTGVMPRTPAPGSATQPTPPPSPPNADPSAADLLGEEGTDEAVSRRIVENKTQVRDRRLAAKLRLHYGHTCQFCRRQVQVGDGMFYAEAAHIRPLGKPHDGPDRLGNMLVLCPNHHVMFDHGMIRLQADGEHWTIVSKIEGDLLHGKRIRRKHKLDPVCVKWHWDWFDEGAR